MASSVRPGRHFPLGATCRDGGVNFALFSENATAVDLCLFDEQGKERRLPLIERTAHVWHGFLPGLGRGQRYGYRVHGPFDQDSGHRFDPRKLLVDPYTRAVVGPRDVLALLRAEDTGPVAPKSVVDDGVF